MDKLLFDRIVTQLLPEMQDKAERKALVESSLFNSALLDRIDWENTAQIFTQMLVKKLNKHGEVESGKPALVALLEEQKKQIGLDRQKVADELIAELMPAPDVTILPSDPAETWDVFISYQRESEAEAKEVNKRLTAAGLRVWQDVNNIRHTARWSQAIDGALRNTDRLILLMTPEAMQSHEVFNEWFYFYNKKKPIHCLMLQTCDPHYQLLPYQYLDWREPDKRDWNRLLAELRADFDAPARVSPSPIVSTPAEAETRLVNPAFADLLEAARDPDGSIALTPDQIK